MSDHRKPIPFHASTKPRQAIKPSKIRDVEFGLHDATDNAAHRYHQRRQPRHDPGRQ